MEKRKRRRRNSDETNETKRVRGSHTSDSKEVAVSKNRPRNKKKKTALEKHDYDATLRLQSYPDFHSLLNPKSLTNLIGACYRTGRNQLERMINDPRTTVGELQAIVLSTDAFDSESNSRMKSKEYSDNRLFGKVKDRVEYSGSDGGAIQIESKSKKLNLDDMSDEELQQLENVMGMLLNKEEENKEVK